VNSVVVPSLYPNYDLNIYYWGGDHGLTKVNRNVWSLSPPTASYYLEQKTVHKLYDLNYFPGTDIQQLYIFIGTDSGLYVNHSNLANGFDDISLVPNTGNYKVFDIDGNICDNTLWLATDKGLVRLQLSYSPNTSFNKNSMNHSLHPDGKITICKDNPTPLFLEPADQYQWIKNRIPMPGENMQSIQINEPGKYQAVLSHDFCQYHISDTTLVTEITYDSIAKFTFKYPDTLTICEGENKNLILSDSGKFSLNWYKNGISLNNNSPFIEVFDQGFYKAQVFNCNLIGKFTDSVFLRVVPIPSLSYSPKVLCKGDTLQLSVASLASRIHWFRNDKEIIEAKNFSKIIIDSSARYTVAYSENDLCESRSDTVAFNFHSLPSLSIKTNNDLPLCMGDSIQLTAVGDANKYLWSEGQNSKSIHVTEEKNYLVKAFSEIGCSISDSIYIPIAPTTFAFLPNLITPNGDDKNDTFKIEGLLPGWSFLVYNSWGGIVYDANDYNNQWNADQLPDGVYFYSIENDHCKKVWKGWVQVIR
jgi:gliding motility-associated-like protein